MDITFKGTKMDEGVRDQVKFQVNQFNADKEMINSITSPAHKFEEAISYTIAIPDIPDAKYYQVGIWDLEFAAPVSVLRDSVGIHTFQKAPNETWQHSPLISMPVIQTAIMWLIVAAAIVIALYFIFK